MDHENGSQNSMQAYLVSLTSEYRLLKELQSRAEAQITDLTQKSERLNSNMLQLNEHYKAYCQTLADVIKKLTNMSLQVEKIKEQLNGINIRLEQVDGQRARCGDRFGEMSGRVEDLDSDIKTLGEDVDNLNKKIQQVLNIVKNTLATRLSELTTKVSTDLPGKLNDLTTSKEKLEERVKTLEEVSLEIRSGFKHLKYYGGGCVGLVTILASLRTLGWI